MHYRAKPVYTISGSSLGEANAVFGGTKKTNNNNKTKTKTTTTTTTTTTTKQNKTKQKLCKKKRICQCSKNNCMLTVINQIDQIMAKKIKEPYLLPTDKFTAMS
jgi:hypothetical protein